jgi:hypothetical protein
MSSNQISSAIKSVTNAVGAFGTGPLANGLRAARATSEGIDQNTDSLKALNPNSPEYYQQLYGTAAKIAQDATAQFAKAQKNFTQDLINPSTSKDKAWERKAVDAISTLKDVSADARDRVTKDLNANENTNRFVNNPNFQEIYSRDNGSYQNFNSSNFDKQGKFVDNTIEDADGNAINKDLKYKFHGFDEKVQKETGLDKKEYQEFNGDAGRLAKDSGQTTSNAKNAQQKIDNTNNLSADDKALLKLDGKSLAFIHANSLNTAGTEKSVDMLKEDKAYIDHAKEKFTNVDPSKEKISEQANKENTEALQELYKGDEAKLNNTLATLKEHGGIEDLSNFNRRTYDRSAKDTNFMLKDSGNGKTDFQNGLAQLGAKGQRATFDIDIRIGGKANVDSNGTGSNVLNGLEFAQKSELKDLIGLQGEGARNQLTFAFQDVDKAKEFVSNLREQFSGKDGSSQADIGRINLSLQGHGAEGNSGGFVADSKKGIEDITDLSKEIGKLGGENGASEIDFNGNCCGSEAQAKQAREGIKEGVEETDSESTVKIRSLANDGRSSNDGANLTDRQGLTGNKYNADGTTSLEEQWSNGHKGQTNAEKYSTLQNTDFANGDESDYKKQEGSKIAKLRENDSSTDEAPRSSDYTEARPESADNLPMPDADENIDDGANNDNKKDGQDDDDGAVKL